MSTGFMHSIEVGAGSLVYAESSLGFISVGTLIGLANTAWIQDGLTPDGDPNRVTQEVLTNALNKAKSNLNFVQATACAYTFN